MKWSEAEVKAKKPVRIQCFVGHAKGFGLFSKGHRESWKHFKQESDVVRFLFAIVPLGAVHKTDCRGEVKESVGKLLESCDRLSSSSAKSLQSCLILCGLYSPPCSSLHGILKAQILEWVATSPGDLPDSGIEPTSLTSPALAGVFFTTSAAWEDPHYTVGSTNMQRAGRGRHTKTAFLKVWPEINLQAETLMEVVKNADCWPPMRG